MIQMISYLTMRVVNAAHHTDHSSCDVSMLLQRRRSQLEDPWVQSGHCLTELSFKPPQCRVAKNPQDTSRR